MHVSVGDIHHTKTVLHHSPKPSPSMSTALPLQHLLDSRKVWRGQAHARGAGDASQPSGHPALDARLPGGGWPPSALTELLLHADGGGELGLLWPSLGLLTRQGRHVVLVAPPWQPHAPAWARAGIDLAYLHCIRADARQAAWAAEQCLRSAACAAVVCWPQRNDDRSLRRLQVAAEHGQCLGFALRDARHANNPSPAALRLLLRDGQVRILKCRGGSAAQHPIALVAQ